MDDVRLVAQGDGTVSMADGELFDGNLATIKAQQVADLANFRRVGD